MNEPVLHLEGVTRRFRQGDTTITVLDGCDLTLAPGEMVALVGPSGSGKSTLLQLAGLLERADGGAVRIDGGDCAGLSDDRRTRLRRERLGFIYQSHFLLPEFSALENVVVPQMVAGVSRRRAAGRARALLDGLGLAARVAHRPGQLSGGEQQRVAVARALANTPGILLADEPTGNLDPATAEAVFGELLRLVRESGLAALLATHDRDLAARLDRVVKLENARLVEG